MDDGTNGVQEEGNECMNAKGIIKMVGGKTAFRDHETKKGGKTKR
jgi:hypothetical protein